MLSSYDFPMCFEFNKRERNISQFDANMEQILISFSHQLYNIGLDAWQTTSQNIRIFHLICELARFGVEVHVSSAAVTWLATQSASWFHRWNGNSPSLKVTHGSVQPAQGGSFVLQERCVDICLLVVGLTVWQLWVSRCKETFTGK